MTGFDTVPERPSYHNPPTSSIDPLGTLDGKNSRATLGSRALLLTWLSLVGAGAFSQEAPPPQEPPPPPTPRPGLFHLGPFYLTPYFHIGTIGLDTNVFYTATDRRTDATATGGPGLELLLPLGGDSRFRVNGTLDYLYFVRTVSQRRWTGASDARFESKGERTELALSESYTRTFSRPNFEVDRRVLQNEEATELDFKRRLLGRISLTLLGRRSHIDVDPGQDFLGTNLQTTLTRDEYRVAPGLSFALSVKTSFVIEADQQWDRFPLDETRNVDSNRLAAGFRTDESALISGRLLGGVRLMRPVALPGTEEHTAYADVDETWNVSPKTKIGGSYSRDLVFSAFVVSGPTPTLLMEVEEARIEKFFGNRVDLKLYGRETRFRTQGEVQLVIPGQAPIEAMRQDKTRQAGADLGYFFRPHLRVGIAASYVDRRSTIAYFGIAGLLVGGTVQYNPGAQIPGAR